MSTALTTFNPSQLELIKNQIAKGCTDAEIEYFIGVCQRTGLDPFQRQIYAIRRKDNKVEKMTIQTGIDGYRLIADRTGRYAGSDDPIHHCDAAGNLASERQSLVFASFSLLKNRLSLGHVRLQMLTEHLKKNLFMGFARVQFHQPYGDYVEVGTVNYNAWSNRFFHPSNHSHCPSLLKALYT